MDDQNPWGVALGLVGSVCLVLAFILFGLSQTSDSLATSGLSGTQLGVAGWLAQAGLIGLVGYMVVRAFEWQAARRNDGARPTADGPVDPPHPTDDGTSMQARNEAG